VPGASGAWLEDELVHQWHDDFPMAWAGYAEAGWIVRTTPWTPSLSYRFASLAKPDFDFYKHIANKKNNLGVWTKTGSEVQACARPDQLRLLRLPPGRHWRAGLV
jgi:hypothetical protein